MKLETTDPAHTMARLYHLIWLISIAVLSISALIIAFSPWIGIFAYFRENFPTLAVQAYLLLVPAAIFVFSFVMFLKKQWSLALTGLTLTLIWGLSKVLG